MKVDSPSSSALCKEQWIVCQIGAREHYILAAELHRRGQLAALCTDIWTGETRLWRAAAALLGARGGGKLRGRYESGLRGARVFSGSQFNVAAQALVGRLVDKQRRWDQIMRANRHFAISMADRLQRSGLLRAHEQRKPIVFAYSYSALEILEAAKSAGCVAILGQIDPGPEEDALIARLAESNGRSGKIPRPSQAYWDLWRRECAIADVVIVNSSWSASLVSKAGIPDKKIQIVPLAYRADGTLPDGSGRAYPKAFTAQRPLNLLFLGQVNLRKGTLELIAAMRRLNDAPLRLRMVGPVEPGLQLTLPANVEYAGPVLRSAVEMHYRQADLFILPTHSDGFAITQLEALAQGLPLITSRHCGDVVIDGQNGRLIDPVTVEAIEERLRWALDHPHALADMAARAPTRLAAYAPERVVDTLLRAVMRARLAIR
jgi:Glycosyl transferases group 1